MKKIELKSMAEYFGKFLPAGKISNRETRLAIVRLYGSLAVAAKSIIDEVEEVRKGLVGDKQEEVNKYAQLCIKASDKQYSEEERKKFLDEAQAMTECVQIDKDFVEASNKIYNEEVNPDIKKVSLEVMFDALADCKFPRFSPDMSIEDVKSIFAAVIE